MTRRYISSSEQWTIFTECLRCYTVIVTVLCRRGKLIYSPLSLQAEHWSYSGLSCRTLPQLSEQYKRYFYCQADFFFSFFHFQLLFGFKTRWGLFGRRYFAITNCLSDNKVSFQFHSHSCGVPQGRCLGQLFFFSCFRWFTACWQCTDTHMVKNTTVCLLSQVPQKEHAHVVKSCIRRDFKAFRSSCTAWHWTI